MKLIQGLGSVLDQSGSGGKRKRLKPVTRDREHRRRRLAMASDEKRLPASTRPINSLRFRPRSLIPTTGMRLLSFRGTGMARCGTKGALSDWTVIARVHTFVKTFVQTSVQTTIKTILGIVGMT